MTGLLILILGIAVVWLITDIVLNEFDFTEPLSDEERAKILNCKNIKNENVKRVVERN